MSQERQLWIFRMGLGVERELSMNLGLVIFADLGGAFLALFFALAIAFWVWMLVDCLKNEADGSTKVAWTIVIALAGAIGAPLYYFLRRLPRRRAAAFHSSSPLYQPWRKDQQLQ